jgi:HK97 family phage prohead protease
MPVDVTDQYIRIRQKDPDDFVQDSFRTITLSKSQGIKAIIGKLKSDPDGSTVIQSYLFDKDKWTVDEAKKWVKEHKEKKSEDLLEELKEIMPLIYSGREIRTFEFAFTEKRKMIGHAAIFNEETEIGGWFREKIEPGAFKSSIRSDDVRALFNHNPDHVLGRNTAGTLKMSEDEKGLQVNIEPPDTQFARDLAISIERGDINQMSFSFQVLEEEWIRGDKKKMDLRNIKKVRLFDVSPVTFPAYEGTDIAIRSHEAWKKEQEKSETKQEPLPQEIVFSTILLRQELLRRM